MAANSASEIFKRLSKMSKQLDSIQRKLTDMSNLLNDASQKLCHLIKRQRDFIGSHTFEQASE